MRDVVVIGGGLSGLAACYELEKRGAAYTVIEVKGRFGGGIRSSFDSGYIMDACAFAFQRFADASPLEALDLDEAIFEIDAETCVFHGGTESLIHALADRLTGGRLMRMAVSSIGRVGNRFTLCLENGLMLDAGAVIVAASARYAARMLYNLAPEAAEHLAGFRYDPIWRVSLGCHKRDLPARIERNADETIAFIVSTDEPPRVPDREHRLIQVGLRRAEHMTPAEAVRQVARRIGLGATPLVARVDYWAEADLLSDYGEDHRQRQAAIRALLPAGLALVGSDYCREAPAVDGVARLEARMLAGKRAAHASLEYLRSARAR